MEANGRSSTSNKVFKVPEIEAEEYRAIDSYEAEGPGQVSFEEGSTIHVLDKMEDGKQGLSETFQSEGSLSSTLSLG